MSRKRRIEILAAGTLVAVLAVTLAGFLLLRSLNEQLLRAAAKGDAPAVQLLLARGASVQAKSPTKETALILAARRGSEETIRVLLERGADPNAKERNEVTALWWVAATIGPLPNRAELAEILLKRGADPNIRGTLNGGATPLTWASVKSEPKLVRVLLRHGVKVNVVYGGNETALQGAQQVANVQAAGVRTLYLQIANTPRAERPVLVARLAEAQAKLQNAIETVRILKQAGATR